MAGISFNHDLSDVQMMGLGNTKTYAGGGEAQSVDTLDFYDRVSKTVKSNGGS